MVVIDNERYLVSMLGEEANWVKNVRAAEGKASLVHGTREHVLLNAPRWQAVRDKIDGEKIAVE